MGTNSTSSSPPGLMHPTVASYTVGAGNPRDSAMLSHQQMDAKQNQLNSSVTGGSRRKSKKGYKKSIKGSKSLKGLKGLKGLNILDWNKAISGGGGTVEVPQMQLLYKDTGGPQSNPNHQIMQNSSTLMQGSENRSADADAMNMSVKKGGNNPNWNWGCLSGGRKSRRHKKNCSRRRRNPRRRAGTRRQ